jgi:hypothetical protein
LSFWCIVPIFNPSKYNSIISNYQTFRKELKANLLTIELSFDGSFQIPDAIHVTSNSVMWQKERLINYGKSLLPSDCDTFAWLDGDIIFDDPNWTIDAQRLLEKKDVVQLFKRVTYLSKAGDYIKSFYSIAWQSARNGWLEARENRNIPFGSPGFAWAARKDAFPNGIYDKDIVGSGDCVLVDCLLGTWKLHGFDTKFNDHMKEDIIKWKPDKLSVGHLPIDIFHLWHGNLHNRGYMRRHNILLENEFDPNVDIVLKDNVYEWATDKPEMHNQMKEYFNQRLDDE